MKIYTGPLDYVIGRAHRNNVKLKPDVLFKGKEVLNSSFKERNFSQKVGIYYVQQNDSMQLFSRTKIGWIFPSTSYLTIVNNQATLSPSHGRVFFGFFCAMFIVLTLIVAVVLATSDWTNALLGGAFFALISCIFAITFRLYDTFVLAAYDIHLERTVKET